jgi:hypothetical protein
VAVQLQRSLEQTYHFNRQLLDCHASLAMTNSQSSLRGACALSPSLRGACDVAVQLRRLLEQACQINRKWQHRRNKLSDQVSLLTLMVGNLLEKSLALAAILTATWRATAL